jgi:hypothetical protein
MNLASADRVAPFSHALALPESRHGSETIRLAAGDFRRRTYLQHRNGDSAFQENDKPPRAD